MSNEHEIYMKRCLQLAQLAKRKVQTNPMVGAVLVYKNEIIGEGFHEQYGQAHAEVNCIQSVKEIHKKNISASTLYVSLEPCSHLGKTPPCVDLILKHNIKKVVVGCTDTYKEVNGTGIQQLIAHGVDAVMSEIENECIACNKRFFTYHQKQRPYIILKWAQTLQHFIAKENSKTKISNAISDRLVHKWRSEEDAIWVGKHTLEIDNPHLTNRLYAGKSPIRIGFNYSNTIVGKHISNELAPTIFFTDTANRKIKNIEFIQCKKELTIQLHALYQRNIKSVLIEGGTHLIQQCIDQNLWDEARVIVSNTVTIDKGVQAPDVKTFSLQDKISLLQDDVYFYRNQNT